jgi:pyruvate dehydrogenase E1 component
LIAASDYIKTYADQIRPYVERRFHALGTDGYGRSDFRRKLRDFFEVDRRWIALAALKALADEGTVPRSTVADALKKLQIDPAKPDPVTV